MTTTAKPTHTNNRGRQMDGWVERQNEIAEKALKVYDEFMELYNTPDKDGRKPLAEDCDQILAQKYNVTPQTIRAWRRAAKTARLIQSGK